MKSRKVHRKGRTTVTSSDEHRTYPVKTIYHAVPKRGQREGDILKVNHAFYTDSAVERAFHHMQHNHYNAQLAYVYDNRDGSLHAVLKRTTKELLVLFKREPVDHRKKET